MSEEAKAVTLAVVGTVIFAIGAVLQWIALRLDREADDAKRKNK